MNLGVGNNWLMTHILREMKHWKKWPQDIAISVLGGFSEAPKHQGSSSKVSAEPSLTKRLHQRHSKVPPNLHNFINPSACQGFKPGISAQDRDVLMHPKRKKEQERRLKMLFYNFESHPFQRNWTEVAASETQLWAQWNDLVAKNLMKIKNEKENMRVTAFSK